MSLPAISLITPTRNRQSLLQHQYTLLQHQSVQDFEWLILDDSPAPSAWFTALDDSRVRYSHHAGPRRSIGAKRNRLAGQAAAPVIAHLDDDDYYAPEYLATMLARIADGADIAKLSAWFVYNTTLRWLGYWDTTDTAGLHFEIRHRSLMPVRLDPASASAFAQNNPLGYGFNHVYRRAVWEKTPFQDADFNEDLHFTEAAIAAGARLAQGPDTGALCLHILGQDNMSSCFPQYLLPPLMLGGLFAAAAPLLAR